MKALRIYGCVAALSLSALMSACGTKYDEGSNAAPASTVPSNVTAELSGVSTSTVAPHACSVDCGVADEPVTLPGGSTVVVTCDTSVYDLSASVDQVRLARLCDFRVTGELCLEDQICASQVISDTGDFPGTR